MDTKPTDEPMTAEQAMAICKKRWGKRAATRYDPAAPEHSAPNYIKAHEIYSKARDRARRLKKAGVKMGIFTGDQAREAIDKAEQLIDQIIDAGDSEQARNALLLTAKWNRANIRKAMHKALQDIASKLDQAAATHPEFGQRNHGMRYRCMVGYVAGIAGFQFFHVSGQGDTWQQAIRQAGLHLQETA